MPLQQQQLQLHLLLKLLHAGARSQARCCPAERNSGCSCDVLLASALDMRWGCAAAAGSSLLVLLKPCVRLSDAHAERPATAAICGCESNLLHLVARNRVLCAARRDSPV